MIHPIVYPASSVSLSIPSSCIMEQVGMSQVPGMLIHVVLMYRGTASSVLSMHGSNHIGFSVWQWNTGHLLLHESSGCPNLG